MKHVNPYNINENSDKDPTGEYKSRNLIFVNTLNISFEELGVDNLITYDDFLPGSWLYYSVESEFPHIVSVQIEGETKTIGVLRTEIKKSTNKRHKMWKINQERFMINREIEKFNI
jgi:hypothetical protein